MQFVDTRKDILVLVSDEVLESLSQKQFDRDSRDSLYHWRK